jgi:hypothetical protein
MNCLKILCIISFSVSSFLVSEPTWLPAIQGKHPRIYLDQKKVTELKTLIVDSPRYASMWKVSHDLALKVSETPPVYKEEAGENLWLRQVGDNLALVSFDYLISGDPKMLAKAQAWALAICDYPKWGNSLGNFCDLPIGHLYQGLGVFYDWCFKDLDASVKTKIRQTILTRGDFYAHYLGDPSKEDYWKVLQNHMWVKSSGLYLAAMALVDEAPEVFTWTETIRDRMNAAMKALTPDGASHKGVGYWQYGIDAMARYLWVCRAITGENGFQNPWWSNTASYALYLSLPIGSWGQNAGEIPKSGTSWMNIDFADCPRYNWYGPDTIFRLLASEYRSGVSETFVDQIVDKKMTTDISPWLNLIYEDASVKPTSLNELPTLKSFEDQGIVSSRDAWDSGSAVVAFKCGPALGQKATLALSGQENLSLAISPNVGHCHPDAGTFCLFAEGDWQIPNAGYVPRRTIFENVLLINGVGQLDQDPKQLWWNSLPQASNRLLPHLLPSVSTPEFDLIAGDATGNYNGLKKWQRRIIFLKPSALIVIDELEADKISDLELLFHFEKTSEAVEVLKNNSFVQKNVSSLLRATFYSDANTVVSSEDQEINNRHGSDKKVKFLVRVKNKTDHWLNAVGYSWAKKNVAPVEIAMLQVGNVLTFSVGTKQLTYDNNLKKVSLK